MTFQEAEELIEKHEDAYLTADKEMLKGFILMDKYSKEKFHIEPAHDIIYASAFSEEMPEKDILQLNAWGFMLEGESECWSMFT